MNGSDQKPKSMLTGFALGFALIVAAAVAVILLMGIWLAVMG